MTNPSFPDDAGTWNKRFEGEDYVFGTEPNAYLREQAALQNREFGMRVTRSVADEIGRAHV